LSPEQVASWQSQLLDRLSPKTGADTRSTLVAVLGAAQDLGLVQVNVAQRVKPPRVPRSEGRAMTPEEVRTLLMAASDRRLGAALTLLFVQGWRVSEVLGLAWQDIDLDLGTAHVVRAAVYVDGAGMVLGPTKTSGAMGVHPLAAAGRRVLGLSSRDRRDEAPSVRGRGDLRLSLRGAAAHAHLPCRRYPVLTGRRRP
jgi:integrase